jgi:hypothetical protein
VDSEAEPVEIGDTNADPVTLGVMSAFLGIGNKIDDASSVLLITTVLLALPVSGKDIVVAVLVAVLSGLAQKFLACRVALDAELFALIAKRPDKIDIFDAALGICAGRRRKPGVRSISSRWVGARRLLNSQLCAFGLQGACFLALLLVR